MKKKLNLKNFLIVLFSGLFLFSIGKIIVIFTEQYKEDYEFEMLAKEVETAQENQEQNGAKENTGSGKASEEKLRTVMEKDERTGILVPYLSLYEKNNDLYGWIAIEGTKINYPVMYTPENPQYYLHRAFDETDSASGMPFLDAACSEEGNLYIIYGHKMKNGTMFGTLSYYEKKEYWEEHPYIYFDTLYEQGTYEIVAAFYSKIYQEDEAGFRYYDYKDLREEKVFSEFCKGVGESALYETDETLSFGDTVLLLSTCSYHTSQGRFVVVAKKIVP